MDEARRSRKTTKFGSLKYVFPHQDMLAMRAAIEASIGRRLPAAKILYWT
jgi:spore photoproduct lyase